MTHHAGSTALPDAPDTGPIPFVDLAAQRHRLGRRIDDAIARVLDHGQYIMGPEVTALEERLARFCGVRHAIGCASGTDALLLVLMAWGMRAGDAVFVPAFTFAATAEAVSLLGAVPVLCDVLPDTFNIDPTSLETAIGVARTAGLRPAAVIPVDLFGQPADYRAIEPIARTHGLRLLADAAQSFGACLDGRRVGAIGDAAATSFFPAKPLGCYGDGGAVLTNDDELAETIRSLRIHGKGSHKYDNVRVGINGRLDTLQAAILIEKLAIFEDEAAARQAAAERYAARLSGLLEVPRLIEGATSAWAQYTVKVERRDEVADRLKNAGIPTAVYYPLPLHRQPAYRSCPTASPRLSVSDHLAGQVLSLPMHPYLDAKAQMRIAEALEKAVRS